LTKSSLHKLDKWCITKVVLKYWIQHKTEPDISSKCEL
jgi:hypothetical protein